MNASRFAPIAALMQTDAYKLDHRRQYGLAGCVTRVYSNYTNRKSRLPGIDHVVHFGLQAYIQKYLVDAFEPFFAANVDEVCALYHERLTSILGADAAHAIGTDHVAALHQLGHLPLEIKSVPEGTLVPIRVPTLTIENTDPEFFWLTNYIETGLSAAIWHPSTSATIAHAYRMVLDRTAAVTGAPPGAVDWQLHDFSYRGMSSHETAAASGAAHLLSFQGTDTLAALEWIDRYYGGPYVAGSVAATEHSVMSTGIASMGGELELFAKLIKLYPSGILSVVSDTFDLWSVLTNVLPALKDEINAREGKLVLRPDSGDPVKILCGNPAGRTDQERKGVVRLLWDLFGGTENAAGFRRLNPKVGVIYGDSITLDRAKEITAKLSQMGFESTTVVFGVGSFTYQHVTRDTFGSAMKATWAEVDGAGVDLFKDPVTDDGTKKSATGRLAVLNEGPDLVLVEKVAKGDQLEVSSVLRTVWRRGLFWRKQSFAEVRELLGKQREALAR